jgi:hypothetical protein
MHVFSDLIRMPRRQEPRSWTDQAEGAMERNVDQRPIDQSSASMETLMAEIAHSPIVVRQSAPLLPAGFDEVDVAILAWLAGEAQRARRHATLM